MLGSTRGLSGVLCGLALVAVAPLVGQSEESNERGVRPAEHSPSWHSRAEQPDDLYAFVPVGARNLRLATPVTRGGFTSVQVNVDANGFDIAGDAANEPSIAVDPTDPRSVVIGWRQFDSIQSNFRQAGVGHSQDAGASWMASVIDPGVFRSDPVLGVKADCTFLYSSLYLPSGVFTLETFPSSDGGVTWGQGVYSYGGDKQWLAVDRSAGVGADNVYVSWSIAATCCGPRAIANRSIDGGEAFEPPIGIRSRPYWGTVAVGPDGEVYVSGLTAVDRDVVVVMRSDSARDDTQVMDFGQGRIVDFGAPVRFFGSPNPAGLLDQVWLAVDETRGFRRGWVYALAVVDPPGGDPADLHFVRSRDGGRTWSDPVRVNDDSGNAWQWFGMIEVDANGRIHAVWNDSRDDPGGVDSMLMWSTSDDGGMTWTENVALTPSFDPHIGWPNQSKIGDYNDLMAASNGVHVAYTATFRGGQDVYHLLLPITP
ncbi:MAG: sialidase family protein [Acidobacteriota bacterium]